MLRPVTKHARSEEWKPVTVIEMKKFLGLIFLTGIVRKPYQNCIGQQEEFFGLQYSCISFLDFMSDIAENLIHTSDTVSSPSSSCDESQGSSRTTTPTPPKHAPKNDPPGRLDGKLKNHQMVHIPPTKNDKMPTRKCSVCVQNNIKKETRFFCAQCGVPLHPKGCYKRHHTLKHY